jgi:DNA-binding MarR family transcriptional regulator
MGENTRQSLTEKELDMVGYLARNTDKTQRSMSTNLGYSLGLTNIILKRLISTGYVKTKQLDAKKVEYMLTPKGFIEKTRKSYKYFLKTIHSLRLIKNNIKSVILDKYNAGERKFIFVGHNELADIAEIAIRETNKADIKFVYDDSQCSDNKKGFYLIFNERITHVHKNLDRSANIFRIITKNLY